MFVPRARVTTTVNSKKNMGNNIQFDIASTQKKNVCIKKINNRWNRLRFRVLYKFKK